MSVELTSEVQSEIAKAKSTKQIILDIDGIPTIYGAGLIEAQNVYGQAGLNFGDAGLVFGGTSVSENSRDYISINGTTKNIAQQIQPDKGAQSSSQYFVIELVDKDNYVSNEMAAGNHVDDILSRNATVYFAFDGLSHPENSIPVIKGVVDSFTSDQTSVKIRISDPDTLNNTELFSPYTDELAITLSNSATDIVVKNEIIVRKEPNTDAFSGYVLIEDEVIRYTGVSGNTFTGCVRAQFGSVAVEHEVDTKIQTAIRIQDKPIDLALKLMLSTNDNKAKESYVSGLNILGINSYATFTQQNALFIDSFNLESEYGISIGDRLSASGLAINTINEVEILSIGTVENVSFVVLDQTLSPESTATAAAEVFSQYDVYFEGVGLNPNLVDVKGFKEIESIIGSTFPEYDFFIKDSINVLDFLRKEIYFPVGMYSLNRKARISSGVTIPPIGGVGLKVLDRSSVINPDQLKPSRSLNEYFYNTVNYNYNKSKLTDTFLSIRRNVNADSIARIPVNEKPLNIESSGISDNDTNNTFLDNQALRFFERYGLAAETIKNIEVSYQFGLDIETGDILELNASDLNLYLYSNGNRTGTNRLMEVINKKTSITTGKIVLDIIDSGFGVDSRFVSFAPSSYIATGATLTNIPVKDSFGTTVANPETDRWATFLNQQVLISSNDYSTQEVGTITNINNGNLLTISGLTIIPGEDYIIEPVEYDLLNNTNKTLYGSYTPTVFISGLDFVSTSQITVGAGEIGKFYIGCEVRISDGNYIDDFSTTVSNIIGNDILLDEAVDFAISPVQGYAINRIGFSSDQTNAYVYT